MGNRKMYQKKWLSAIPFLAVLVAAIFILGVAVGNSRSVELNLGFFLNPPAGSQHEDKGVHIDAWLTKTTGEVIYLGHHAGTMTTIGYDYVQDQLFDSTSSNSSQIAYYMSLSNSSSAPSAAWTQIPTEITTGGLDRVAGTYGRTSATVLTIFHQWIALAPNSGVKVIGFSWKSSGDNNLMWADVFTTANMAIGEKLTVTGTITLT